MGDQSYSFVGCCRILLICLLDVRLHVLVVIYFGIELDEGAEVSEGEVSMAQHGVHMRHFGHSLWPVDSDCLL